MNNLVQCNKCRKICVDEEYDSHTCLPKVKEWKKVKIAHFYTSKDESNVTHHHILGWDGIDYDFVEVFEVNEPTKLPYIPTNRQLTDRNTNHEDNSTLTVNILTIG